MPAAAPVPPSFTEALRALDALLMRGEQRTARRNAWAAVLEDRGRARARTETEQVLEAAAERAPLAT